MKFPSSQNGKKISPGHIWKFPRDREQIHQEKYSSQMTYLITFRCIIHVIVTVLIITTIIVVINIIMTITEEAYLPLLAWPRITGPLA